MSILILLNFISMRYCLSLLNIKQSKIFNILLVVLTIIFIFLVFVLELNVIYYGNVLDGDGPSYDITMIYTVISFIFFILIFIYFILSKQSIKKMIPFIVLILLYLVSFVLRARYKELIFEGFFYSYILLLRANPLTTVSMLASCSSSSFFKFSTIPRNLSGVFDARSKNSLGVISR